MYNYKEFAFVWAPRYGLRPYARVAGYLAALATPAKWEWSHKKGNPCNRGTVMKQSFCMILMISVVLGMGACKKPAASIGTTSESEVSASADGGSRHSQNQAMSGQIYLYGEMHSDEKTLEKEIALWHAYYHDKGMRHLFVELPYYSAEYLNLWMHEDSDDILEQLYKDNAGTQAHSEAWLAFYRRIKKDYPETVFHGVDVGHQYNTTGERYLADLRRRGMDESSEEYRLAKECMEQGRRFYGNGEKNHESREISMTENFLREYQALSGMDIMGIFGGSHVDPEGLAWHSKTVPSMANQLKKRYGDSLHAEDLSFTDKVISIETIRVNGKDYQASYFGKVDLGLKGYRYRKFWRLENAYDDFKDYPRLGNYLSYSNYPMKIETGNIYVVEYTRADGTIEREVHRADGNIMHNMLVTDEMRMTESGEGGNRQ